MDLDPDVPMRRSDAAPADTDADADADAADEYADADSCADELPAGVFRLHQHNSSVFAINV